MIEDIARWLDRRVGGSAFVQDKLTKVFPESWTFLFGEVALYSFIVLVITGTYLAFFYEPSLAETVYYGDYDALDGVEMSAAYRSVIEIAFDTRAGLFIRQTHHWAALVFAAAIVVHLCRIFFTGAFRKPREVNWMLGVTLLLLALLEGFAGYSLPDDLLSGIGLRIGYSIMESIPVVGTWLASFAFGGMFPGDAIIQRLYIGHVFILPMLFFGLIGLHLSLVFRQTHTQFPGAGRREDNIVGVRMWPTYAAMSAGLFLLVFAILAALGGLVQINPVWFYGPYDAFLVTIGAQPDWYMGWLEGALRIFPPWEFRGWGVMIANPFFPAVLLPALTFLGLYLYPYVERWLTGDRAEHHLLQRPRHAPVRTAFGAGMLTFYSIITIAGSQDLIALQLNVSISGLVWWLRILALVAPVAVAMLAYRWARDLAMSEHSAPGTQTHSEVAEDEGGSHGGSGGWGRMRRRWGVALGAVAAMVGIGAARRERRGLL